MVTKKLLSFLFGVMLIMGCATSQETVTEPEVITPPATIEESIPSSNITRNKYKRDGVTVYEWKKTETDYDTVIIARREEAFEIRLVLILGVESNTPMIAEGMYDSRGTDDYDVYNFNREGVQGVALVFKNHYEFLFLSLPTNTMYVQYPVQGTYAFELSQAEWDDVINTVTRKKGF